ncbi:autotransporter beta-domain protein [Leptotrichia sp. oral taxon 215 str. W9775]|uniref:autotransporter-associated N-terminal domain-containing protein n=1 Tax=Leptotrichia sp. oral taxon 215 TaxID=712359 RepID=UPI0003ADE67C|nr:autotransporter-associated N-terminal domain-containing protein [Leptotrichia sp. oral taxon 215]ERK67585.1 autotransporter beta-domain protein [Leptotrichia sp. oral taxon 215 str. W9775]
MNGTLRRIEKELRNIAKRYKNIKYSKSLLLSFLVTGGFLYGNEENFNSKESESTKQARLDLNNSIEEMKQVFREAKKENDKLIKKNNFELVQLMEQGDHVVKSPWASWQTGANYIYSKWNGTYKGRGNKIKDEVLTRDTTGNLNKFLETGLNSISYGSTNLGIVHEPDVEIKISAGIKPKIINRQAPSYKPATPEVSYPTFDPRFITSPVKPSAPAEITPTTFDPPALNFVGGGFIQNQIIGMTQTNIIVQNYEKYSTEGVFKITAGAAPGWLGTKWEGKLNVETTLDPTKNGSLTTGQTGNGPQFGMNTFINDLRDHNTMFTGEYELTDLGGRSWTKSFISYNPAGVGGDYSGYYTPGNRTSTFAGKLTLHGIPVPVNSNVLVGIEHQLWATSRNHPQSSSTLLNTGEIILASGNNVVGIMIDIERMVDPDRIPHKTINDGKIIINNQNSIGMDFGQYIYGYSGVFKVDVSLGNIIVNGKNNYGARMKNIFVKPQTDPLYPTWSKYYDMVTVTSGTGKKITVNGEENVGMAIGKSLSAVARESAPGANDTNPIANISDLNIEVAGEKNIGFLRLKDYSDNNTNDMILDSTTMGTFTFGNGAKNSSLVRTDKHGIQVKKDITATGIDDDGNDYTGSGNTVLHSNGQAQHIYNYNTITVGKGFTKTVGMAATGTTASTIDNIVNEGTIDLQAKQSIGMYTDKFSQGKNTGSIKLSGVGDTDPSGNIGDAENIGISNKGKFEFSGNLEVNGKKSSGIYNTGTATIEAGPNPTDKANIKATNGATGLYSKGTGSTITSNAGDKLNINVEAGTTKEGLAVYAENQAQITLHDANITVNGGSAGAAAYDTGTKIDLTGATLKYDGNGYAAYSDGQGEIDLSNSNIELRGRSTLMNVDFSSSHRPITTSSTNVTVYSNDVVGINLNNLGTQNVSNLSAIKNSLGIVLNPGTEGGQTFNKFKELAIDNGTINFDVATDKNEGDTTPGGFFFKKVLGQRLKLNVNENLTARLSSADANEFYNGQVVGLEANSSDKAVTNTEAQVNIVSGKTVDVARTDGTDKGGVGVFVNYGQVNNSGTINVEKDSSANSNAVGIYAVNGSEVVNNGSVNVSGEKSIGLLGIAYRTDTVGNVVVDEFGTGAAGQGKVNITNRGDVNLDGEGAIGIFAKNNKAGTTFTNAVALNDTAGVITTTGTKSVGMAGEGATITNNGTINVNGQIGTGMFGEASSRMENSGTINIAASTSPTEPNIGMYTEDQNTKIYNNKDIIGGDNTYGIYGKTIDMASTGKIKVGSNSVGIYSNGQYTSSAAPNVTLASGSSIEVGNNQSVGVFATGQNQNILSQADMRIGDNSYGYVVKGTGTKLTITPANSVTVGNDTVYIYSTDTTGNIENRTALTSTGNNNYGIYAAGNVTNLGDVDFSSGIGNVGMYSISGGTIVNGSSTVNSVIKVGASDTANKLYGIGMVAGYTDDNGNVIQTGTVENYGTIKVEKDNGIGMYATGSGSTAKNYGTIELSGKNTTGMHLDNNAVGENYGTIKTVPNPTNDGIVGVSVQNGAVIKNYGNIIVDGNNNTGIYLSKGKNEGVTPTATNGAVAVQTKKQTDTTKRVAGIEIKAPGNGTATVSRDGNILTPTFVDTTVASPNASRVVAGSTELDLTSSNLGNTPSAARASEIGMYVDTSGINYTNPIQGLQYLTGVNDINLIFGTEASRYTDSKDIKIGENILKPYNDEISVLTSGGTGKNFKISSGSLTWIATGTQNSDDTFNAVYLSKIPYTAFAKDQDTYNFMNGLEQRYGIEGTGSREKVLFDKLNAIGKGEPQLFAQAVDQMKGHQYSNVQQRVNATGKALDKEFDYLRNEWRNTTKNSNKIKAFGMRDEYNTDTAGVIDYTSNAYGVAYIHENEAVKLGNSSGWYAGAVNNNFRFKDVGKSRESQTMLKAGIFKTMSPMTDHNGSLQWTIGGDVFVGRNEMKRKYLVVDDIFEAKSAYNTYGVSLKNELGYDIRMSERTHLRPYGSLKMEYGRFSDIKEETGQMRLEVEGNDYFSVKPEVGLEFKYVQPLAVKTQLSVGLTAAYENELGRLQTGNRARVGYTSADWYNLEKEKEDRRGNGKFDLNIGIDNTRFGVTVNAGYDTKGHNVRGGIGFRAIY